MKNEIKKILLLMKGIDLDGIIVLRDESIKKYEGVSNAKLKKEYSNLIQELKEQYKTELIDLNEKEVVNKLYSLGKIEYQDAKTITKITNYLDSDEKPIKFVLDTVNGQEEIKFDDCFDESDYYSKFKEKLVLMCNAYDIKLETSTDLNDSLIEKLKKADLLETKKEEKEIEKNFYNTCEVKEDEVTVGGSKIKNFVVNHKLISGLIAAGVIGLVLSIPGCSKKNNNKVNNEDYSSNNDKIYEEISFEEEPVIEVIPTVEPLEYFQEIAYVNEESIFPCYIETSDRNLIALEYDGRSYDISDYYYGNIDNLIATRNENMSNVANYIQSNIKIRDKGIYIYHENLFNSNLRDKAFVKYFSMFGNQIIKNAYQNKDYGLVVNNAVMSDEAVIELINDNLPLEVYIHGERQEIYFNELSHDAKEIVLNIAWTNNLPLNKEIVLSGYNQDDISNIILEQADMLNMIR